MLALHLALRWLRRRRAAWLALAAVTVTVTVPVVVLGVMQGWLEVTRMQVRASESDLVLGGAYQLLPHDLRWSEHLSQIEGIAAVAPSVLGEGVMVPRDVDDQGRFNVGVKFEGVDLAAEQAMGRLIPATLHPRPGLDLSAPALDPEERGSGFLTQEARAHLALAGLEAFAGLAGCPLPAPPRPRAFSEGIIIGRELVYALGGRFGPGNIVSIVVPDGRGGAVGRILAEISDTVGTGVYEIDRYTVFMSIPQAQRLKDMAGRNPASQGRRELSAWRLVIEPGTDLEHMRKRVEVEIGRPVSTWMELRGNLVQTFVVQRNVMVAVMVFIQLLCVFIIYAVFSTLVAEKRHDIGVLLGLGSRRRSILATFLIAALVACVGGGVFGWALGWGILVSLDPVLSWFDISLFPQDVIYTPYTPISYDPAVPLFFVGLAAVVGLLAALLPALRAARIDPVATMREAA